MAQSVLMQAWRYLARTRVAAILIVIVLLLAAFGSCFPQLSPTIASDIVRLTRWEAAVRAKYGPLSGLLAAGGAFQLYRAPLFLVAIALLAFATLACTLQRWRGIWQRAFRQPVPCSEATLDNAPHTARLSAPSTLSIPNVVRKGLQQQGFHVRTEAVGNLIYVRGDRNRFAPLGTLITHLAVLLLLSAAVISGMSGWHREVTIRPGETVELGTGSGVRLRNDGFNILRYADGNIAAYQAALTLSAPGHGPIQGILEVNKPLTFADVKLILSGYAENSGAYDITLLAVHDPSYGVVIAAGVLLFLGMSITFYLPHCYVQACIEPNGTVRLAGRADGRAYGFGHEFATLAETLTRTMEAEAHRNPPG